MKKVFFILLFICSSFLYGQNQEKLVISGWKQETGVIDYYENGLIKNSLIVHNNGYGVKTKYGTIDGCDIVCSASGCMTVPHSGHITSYSDRYRPQVVQNCILSPF